MNIYVLNEQFQKTSIIDVYESFIWTDRYYESGDFELVVPASIEMVSILQKDLYLSIENGTFKKPLVPAVVKSNKFVEILNKIKCFFNKLINVKDKKVQNI